MFTITKSLYTSEVSGTGNPANAGQSFTPVNCQGLTKANGYLVIELKCSNPSILHPTNAQIEITSSGGFDSNEWSVTPPSGITTDWKTFIIPLSSAVTYGGELDVTAINYIRWYNFTTDGSVTIYWKNAHIRYASDKGITLTPVHYEYNYKDITDVIEDGSHLWIAFGTNPAIIAKVTKENPNIIVAAVTLDSGYYFVSNMSIDGDNIWVSCSLDPGKMVVINKNTLVKTNISSVPYRYPHRTVFTSTYAVVSTWEWIDDKTYLMFYNKSTFAYQFTVTVTNNPYCRGLAVDSSENIWGTSLGATGKIFRIENSSGYPQTNFTVPNIDYLSYIHIDSNDDMWLGGEDKLSKAWIGSGDILDNIVYELESDTRLYAIKMEENGDIKFYACGGYNFHIAKGYITGTMLVYEKYATGLNVGSARHVIADSTHMYAGLQSNPAQLIKASFETKQSYVTDLRLKIKKYLGVITNLVYTKVKSFFKVDTDLRYLLRTRESYVTDLRTRTEIYNEIEPKSLDDIVVYKDSSELIDVDYNTLRITYNLNKIPSEANFVLARHHDDLDKRLDGVASVITNENKIEIKDGTKLLFTGYITQITANSDSDTVTIKAQDVRYKINKESMEIEYGGKYDTDLEERIQISTKSALESVFSEISSLISGYDTVDFGFTPEYVKEYNDCGTLIDTLIRNSANINWYVDENEYIRFQKIEKGIVKTLALSSLDKQRHIYDTILNDIVLNRQTDNYYSALEIIFGQRNTRRWIRTRDRNTVPTDGSLRDATIPELTWFGWQEYIGELRYCGEGISTLYSAYTLGSGEYLKAWWNYQWLIETFTDVASITVGSGEPKKTLYLNNYGAKETAGTVKWEEREDENGIIYLYHIIEEHWDYTTYASDLANFELSQNNKLLTEARISLLLDAYEYYDIDFKSLINISNTLEEGIYKNNNGFPLNISNVVIDCSNRTVSMNLTNYGQSWYQRIGNYIGTYVPEKVFKSIYRKRPVVNPQI